jgi:sugar phosphate isomerase/epimerase
MDKHWDAYCGLSIVHFMAFPECQSGQGPILETISQIAEDDFFSGIEVTRINDAHVRRQVAVLLEQTRVTVDFGVHPVILAEKHDINSLIPEERQHACAAVESYLEQAAELNARRFVLLSGPDPGELPRSEATLALIDSLQHICAAAQKLKLEVVLETFDRAVDKRALIGPAEDALRVAAIVRKDFPRFGVLYDMAHGVLLDEEPVPAMQLLGEYLTHVHVGNCVNVLGQPGYGDLHPRFGYPEGVNDVAELADFINALFEVGYLVGESQGGRPGVGFEIRPQPGETSGAILVNLKRAWRAAWPLVHNWH